MSHKIFDNNLEAIQKSKLALKLSKLAYTGLCVFELSKVLMYEFHYGYIKNKYDNKLKLLFRNTDSLMYKIKTEDVYEGCSSNKEMFDFSNYSNKSQYFDNSKKLVISKRKDEVRGFAIEALVELKHKFL